MMSVWPKFSQSDYTVPFDVAEDSAQDSRLSATDMKKESDSYELKTRNLRGF